MKRATFIAVLSIALATAGRAQIVSPNVEKGVSPGKAFSFSDVDTVNLFNGNLSVSIPIGQQYSVGGGLTYQLMLHYSGNAWEHQTRDYEWTHDGFIDHIEYAWSFPARRRNAGFGWRLSLGELYIPEGASDWVYEGPDGAVHGFHSTLHVFQSGETSSNVYYTTDGTYLRLLTGTSSDYIIEFPNGERHHFEYIDNFTRRLTKIEDRYSNYVNIDYNPDAQNPYAGGNTWHITDSQNRHHSVYFKPTAVYTELEANVPHQSVAEIRLATFSQSTVSYKFEYENESTSQWSTISRACPSNDPTLLPTVTVPLLIGITAFDGTTALLHYAMDYARGDLISCNNDPGFPGNMTGLTLPSGGRVEWSYTTYVFPSTGLVALDHVPGVALRKICDGVCDKDHTLSQTSYQTAPNNTYIPSREKTTTVTVTDAQGEPLTKSVNYFNTCATEYARGLCQGCPGPAPPRGASCPDGPLEYGLPFTRRVTDATGTRFLSSEALKKNTDGSWTPARSTYVSYAGDYYLRTPSLPVALSPYGLDINRRLEMQRTKYEDGATSDTTYSDFDGLGHYRQTVIDGSITGGAARTLFTNFNPSAHTFTVNSDSSITGGFVMPASSAPWVLGTYTYTTATEGVTAKTEYCFEASTGFLQRRRILKAAGNGSALPAVGSNDLLAVFTRDSAGNVTDEQYLGGDSGVGVPAATCTAAVTAENYKIHHTYVAGSLESSKYLDASGSQIGPRLVDRTIDASTGFARQSREGATASDSGVTTNFTFDVLGRLTFVKPQDSSWTRFDYQMQPPRVDEYDNENLVTTTTAPIRHRRTEFDVLGRVTRETRNVASLTVQKTTKYNPAGWKIEESESSPDTTAPTHFTKFTYDDFGRPTTITAADGSAVTIEYTGVSKTTRKTSVRTGGDATTFTPTIASTIEEFDRQGRLSKVTEPSETVTAYTYDVGGRLTGVCSNYTTSSCGQQRSFTYDQRGFLNSETHPEKGAGGNGTTTYPLYDARGHLLQRYDGASSSKTNVTFAYDRAERLTAVSETNSGRPLKQFSFGTTNDLSVTPANYANGKTVSATRYNWLDPYNIQIVESYEYRGKDGRPSKRTTIEQDCVVTTSEPCTTTLTGEPPRKFEQSFVYDALGSVSQATYPQCLQGNCNGVVAGTPIVTNTYIAGWLTGVNAPYTGSGTISYHENGMVNQVIHANGVTDTQTPDGSGMPRPGSIATTGAFDGAACTAPTITTQPVGGTTNPSVSLTLSAAASGDTGAGHPLTYQWYRGTTGDLSAPLTGETGTSVIVSPATTTSYWMRAKNNCGLNGADAVADSATAQVVVCSNPTISAHPASATITKGMSRTLTVSASAGTTYQWHSGVSGSGTAIAGATGSSLTISPDVTTSYWVKVSGCSTSVNSSTATVTVVQPPTVPASLDAWFDVSTAQSTPTIHVSWSASASSVGIARYEVQRSFDGASFVTVGSVQLGTSFNDTQVVMGKAYVYNVHAVDSNNIAGLNTGNDIATAVVFSNDPLPAPPTATLIRGIHVSELRSAIDAVRRSAGLPAQWTSYSPLTGLIYASTFNELRNALADARNVLGLPAVTYSQSTVVPGMIILRSDLTALRGGVK